MTHTVSPTLGMRQACAVMGVPRSTLYRQLRWADAPAQPASACPAPIRATPQRALSVIERATVLAALNSERFCDLAPREVYGTLLDEGTYYCDWRTMYRILAENSPLRERRDQLRHPAYAKPELLANAPNQVWSWDITKLPGPAKWVGYYLYVLLDIFSRFVVGWLIAERQSADLAKQLISDSCAGQHILPDQLSIHADNGGPMTAKPVSALMLDLGVLESHSRPHVSNDNPFSEAQFKTTKYHPSFPQHFGSPEHARLWARGFFRWYNHDHHHSALALLTPATLHAGLTTQILAARQRVLLVAFAAHPERFPHGPPSPALPPAQVWINPPTPGLLSPHSTQEVIRTDVPNLP